MATEERLEQLERSLQPAASMVDMRVLGKPSIFAGDEASWKSWSFVMLSFSAGVSPELRALMKKARTNVVDMLNVNLTAAEQVWSRQLYYMLSLSTSGRRRGDCRTCHREKVQRRGSYSLNTTSRKQPRGMSECSGRFSCMTSGSSLRQLTIPSYVSDDEFHSPMRIFALRQFKR